MIKDGIYQAGPFEGLYYIINLVSILILTGIVISYRKNISKHDMFAAISYCIVPIISFIVTLITGINVTITLMSIIMLLIYIMLKSENESILYGRANIDELTGLYNRAAYEDEVQQLENSQPDTLVYASVDVNGLKNVNDTLGHTAGDEFVSIFYADKEKLSELKTELESLIMCSNKL